MPRTKISEFSATAASNTDIDSINIAEGCAPSGINDAIRELMSQLKDFQTGAVGDSFNGPVGSTTASTGAFTNLTASGTLGVTGVATLGAGAILNTPASVTLTNATGLPLTTGTTGTLATTKGGTGLTSFTANGVVYASSSSALATGSALTFDGTTLNNSGAFGTSTAALTLKNSSAANSSNIVEQQFFAANSFSGLDTIAKFGALNPSAGANNYGTFYWSLANAGSPSEQMRLTSTGLGIGTSSPAYKLDVTASAGTVARFTGGTALSIYSDTGNTSGVVSGVNGIYFNTSGQQISFTTNSSTKALLNSVGNFGLGVTPSPGNAGTCLEAGTTGNIFRGGTINDTNLDSNAYYNSGWKYANTGYATRYGCGNNAGQHLWFTAPSGTAGNAITFTQAMTLDASGNLLLGTTSQAGSAKFTLKQSTDDTTGGLAIVATDGNGAIISRLSDGNLTFRNGGAERMRIDSSGNFILGGTTAYAKSTIQANASGGPLLAFRDTNASSTSYEVVVFNRNGTQTGSITITNTATAYNTSSDQRLKENIVDAPEFGSVIDSIQVRSFDWKTSQTHQRAGFIAQELVTVAPEAVHQPEDTEQMMAVDYSKLVPMLVKEIQSLRVRVAQLESN